MYALFDLALTVYSLICHVVLIKRVVFTERVVNPLVYIRVAQWLSFWVVNYDIMGSNPTQSNFVFLFIFFCGNV